MEAHPEQLRGIASKIDEVAAAVRASPTGKTLAPAAGQSAGWASAAAAQAAAGSWGAFTGRLADAVQAMGTGLRASADQYHAADQAAATANQRHADRLRYAV